MTYKEALKKRRRESLLVMPIVILGKLLSALFRPRSKHRLFLIAPTADLGGANKINADILSIMGDKYPIVIFTKKPKNNQFRNMFDLPNVRVWDIHKLVDNKMYHFINVFYRGVISRWINNTENVVVLGGESIYFYKVLPWLKKDVRKIDLTHVDVWFDYTQQFVNDINCRVFGSQRLMKDAQEFYTRQGIEKGLLQRITYVDSMVYIPDGPVFADNDELEVVYIGRGAPQKRVELIAEIAKLVRQRRVPAHISFVGDVAEVINPKSLPFCTFYGTVNNREKLLEIQKKSDVLLLTSKFEGLPVALMEMMALGKAVVSTAVNAIPDYIKDGENGYLLPADSKDKKVVEDAIIALSILGHDRTTLREMGMKNHNDAKAKFGKNIFLEKWRKIIG